MYLRRRNRSESLEDQRTRRLRREIERRGKSDASDTRKENGKTIWKNVFHESVYSPGPAESTAARWRSTYTDSAPAVSRYVCHFTLFPGDIRF